MAFRSIHDFTVKDVRGNDVELSRYKGKALLMVNVTSESYFCCSDLTHPHYTELAQLHGKYKHHGLEILPFPFNQVHVHGPNAAPLHKYLKSTKGGQEGTHVAEWNFGTETDFAKVLIDKHGNIAERYISSPSPFYNAAEKRLAMAMHHASVTFEASPVTTAIENQVKNDLDKVLGTDIDGNVVERHIPTASPSADAFEKRSAMAMHHASVTFEANPVTTAIENQVKNDLDKVLGTDKDGNVIERHIPTASPSANAFEKQLAMAMHHAPPPFEASPITMAIENDVKKHLGIA